MSFYTDIKATIGKLVPALNNTSASSIVDRIVTTVASALNIVELEMNNSEQTVENAARSLKVMGRQYYIDLSLAYQAGSVLSVINPDTYEYGYATVDPSKQIIKQVAISVNGNGHIVIKVAKLDADGYIEQLDPDELQSFADYMEAFTPFGFQMQIVSSIPATLNCQSLYIRYSKEYSFSVIKQALSETLLSFQSRLRGDDPLYVNDIESAIKEVDGIRDAYFNGISVTDAGSEDPITPENGVITIPAGYFNFAQELIELKNLNPSVPTNRNDIYVSAV